MNRITTQKMIDQIVASLPLGVKAEFADRTRSLFKHQIAVLVRLAKQEQMAEMREDVAKLAAVVARADARRQCKLLLRKAKAESLQAPLKFD